MEAKAILYIRLTKTEIKSINLENKSKEGSSQTYIDIPKGQVSDIDMNNFFGEPSYGVWKVDVYSLGSNGRHQIVEIYSRRDTTNSIRNQTNNRIYSWKSDGFPITSEGYDEKSNPVIVYFIKDDSNKFWAGWFYQADFNNAWFVNITLAQIIYSNKRAGLINLDTHVIFTNNNVHWPFIKNEGNIMNIEKKPNTDHKLLIYYGTPGSGKSHKVKELYDDTNSPDQIIRTTFHPDTDYSSFVGGYKPMPVKDKNGETKITYCFVPQSFTIAYVKAWNDLAKSYYLIIEEINRGNCAQIFGDIFQLLDRKDNGISEYPINADTDLKDFLKNGNGNDEISTLRLTNPDGIKDDKLCLPPNLSIIATMNTSDQSLFPMDTAFKRRWEWEYIPIEYDNEKSSKFTITIDGNRYMWKDFLKNINERIKDLTDSEDKQMGNFFIKHSVTEDEFINKVMFYLWSEVGKDNYNTNERLFECFDNGNKDNKIDFSFNELFDKVKGPKKLKEFMEILKVGNINKAQQGSQVQGNEAIAKEDE